MMKVNNRTLNNLDVVRRGMGSRDLVNAEIK
jgi:hypothetical protein